MRIELIFHQNKTIYVLGHMASHVIRNYFALEGV